MEEREEWFSNQVSKLVNEDLRVTTLSEIKDYFANISHDEAIRTAKNMELSLVFDCLNDTNPEQVDLACDVLSLCMSNLSLGDTTNRYSTPLERALNHPHSSVKIMALKEILRNLSSEELLVNISRQHNLVCSVLQCVADDSLAVATTASAVILEIGKSSYGIQQLLFSDCLKIMENLMAHNEIVRMRFNEIFIDISIHSEKFMHVLASVGLLQTIFKDLDSNDVLLKLNVIELLSRLVVTEHGYKYLEGQGVVLKIFSNNDDDSAYVELVKPAIFKFFGHIAHWKPAEMISKYDTLMDQIFFGIDSQDPTILVTVFDTIGHIGKTNEGKIALATGSKIVIFMKRTFVRLIDYPVEVKIRALDCIENVFRMTVFDVEITKTLCIWFKSIEAAMEITFQLAKNPFSEIRLAGIGVLSAYATHEWAHRVYKNTPGFIEYLLDRNNETFKDCKEVKYEIVKLLSASAVFDENTQRRFQEFVREGPFYVQALPEVAVQGED